MAKVTVGTISELLFRSKEGSATAPDIFSVRLAPGAAGFLYLELMGTAATTTSYWIDENAGMSFSLVGGQYVNAVTDTGTVEVRIFGPQTATYGS